MQVRVYGLALALFFTSCASWRPPVSGKIESSLFSSSTPLHSTAQARAIHLRWSRALIPFWSQVGVFDHVYHPVEYATPVVDPARNRILSGTSEGLLYGWNAGGKALFRYPAHAPILASPVIDPQDPDIVYVVTLDGIVHAIDIQSQRIRWRHRILGTLRRKPCIDEEVLYVQSEQQSIIALSKQSGEELWVYRRPTIEGIRVAGGGHPVLTDKRLIAVFDDGAVVSINRSNGRTVWERDTTLDLDDDFLLQDADTPKFLDVDTTPVIAGNSVWIASAAAGLYELSLTNGSVLRRFDQYRTVVGLAKQGNTLVVASAEHGVMSFDLPAMTLRWHYDSLKSTPAPPVIAPQGLVFVGETQGALIVLDLEKGYERGRIGYQHGFSAPAVVSHRLGFALSNGGTLFALSLQGSSSHK